MKKEIKIKKLNPSAVIPGYAHKGDAGMDLFSAESLRIKPGQIVKVKTGIAMEIPPGFVGLVWDKSGLAMNSGLKVLGGVVDSGYRGEIIVGIVNLSSKTYRLNAAEKIAQMLIQKVESFPVEIVKNLSETKRGSGGFGSTGKTK